MGRARASEARWVGGSMDKKKTGEKAMVGIEAGYRRFDMCFAR
jgi:hypothetical protein